jgi:hypothetical protein
MLGSVQRSLLIDQFHAIFYFCFCLPRLVCRLAYGAGFSAC